MPEGDDTVPSPETKAADPSGIGKIRRRSPRRVKRKMERQPGLLANHVGCKHFVYDPRLFAPMSDEELKQAGWE